MNNTPYGPADAGQAPKKDHTVAIVLIILLVVFVLPMIAGIVMIFFFFNTVENIAKEVDFNEYIPQPQLEIGAQMTHNEVVSVRNIVGQLEAKSPNGVSISKKDCNYLRRVASYYDDEWFTEKDGVAYCDNSIIYGSVSFVSIDQSSFKNMSESYTLYLSDQTTCATFNFDGALSSITGYSLVNKSCMFGAHEIQVVDTGEELEPLDVGHGKDIERHEDDDDEKEVTNTKA